MPRTAEHNAYLPMTAEAAVAYAHVRLPSFGLSPITGDEALLLRCPWAQRLHVCGKRSGAWQKNRA